MIIARTTRSTPRPIAATRFLAILAFALALVLPLRAARAQEPPKVTVQVSRDRIDLGDSFTYQLTIDGASAAQQRALPESDAYKADYLGGQDQSSHSIFTINRHTTESTVRRYVMQWRVTPLKPGRGTIPSFELKVGDKALTVPSVDFTAREPGDNPNFVLKLEPEKTEAYVGEPVHVKLVWYVGGDVRSAAFSGPDGGKVYDIAATDPRPIGSRSNPIQRSDPYRVVPFLNGQAVIRQSSGSLGDREVTTYTLDLVITPRQAGSIGVGPYRVVFDEVVGQRRPTFFDFPGDDLAQTRRSVVASDTLTLNVKPLPEEGRPADFNGLIGNYTLHAQASNTEANVGDPITLTLTVHGPEPLDSLKPPSLDSQPQVTSDFKPGPEGWDTPTNSGDTPGQRTFTTTIRPKSDSVSEIPPIRLPYFDTSEGKYQVAKSNAIPLRVHAAKEVTLADAIRPGATSGIQLPAGTPAKLTDAPPGVGANSESLDALVDQRVNLLSAIRSPAGVAFIALPPLAVAAIGLIAYRKRTIDPDAIARRAALASARRAVRSANSAGELSAAMRSGLAPFLDVSPDAVTSRDAAVRSLPRDTGARAADLLSDLESAAYDRTEIDIPAARNRASEILSELNKA